MLKKVGDGVKNMVHRKQHRHLSDFGIEDGHMHKVTFDHMKGLCDHERKKVIEFNLMKDSEISKKLNLTRHEAKNAKKIIHGLADII